MLNFSKKPLFEKLMECDLNKENNEGEPALFLILKNNREVFSFNNEQLIELIEKSDKSLCDKNGNSLLMVIIQNQDGQKLNLPEKYLESIIKISKEQLIYMKDL